MIRKTLIFIASIFVTLLFVEAMTYFPDWYWGDQYFMPQALNKSLESPTLRPGSTNGGVGVSSKKSEFKILSFGDSILEGKGVEHSQNWLSLMVKTLGNVQLENFAIGWSSGTSIVSKMDELIMRGEKYDLLIIQKEFFRNHHPYRHKTFHHSFRWTPDPRNKWRTLSIIKKWIKRKQIYEEHLFSPLKFFNDRAPSNESPIDDEQDLNNEIRAFFKRNSESWNRRYLSSKFVRENLTDSPRPISSKKIERMISNIDEVMKRAPLLAKKVIWIPTYSNYTPREETQTKQTYSFMKRQFDKKGNMKILSALGLYRYFEAPAKVAQDYFAKHYPEVNIFDYSPILSLHSIKSSERLYIDDLHLDIAGHQIVSESATLRIREIFSEIKSQNK